MVDERARLGIEEFWRIDIAADCTFLWVVVIFTWSDRGYDHRMKNVGIIQSAGWYFSQGFLQTNPPQRYF